MILHIYAIIHVLISLVGIFTALIVVLAITAAIRFRIEPARTT